MMVVGQEILGRSLPLVVKKWTPARVSYLDQRLEFTKRGIQSGLRRSVFATFPLDPPVHWQTTCWILTATTPHLGVIRNRVSADNQVSNLSGVEG